MSPAADRLPPLVSDLIATLAAAVPIRARRTFLDLLLGAALAMAGHVTAAILRAGLSRSWTTYFWFLEQGRWSWLAVMAALRDLLVARFTPPVWHVIIDDTMVERCSAKAPGAQVHYNHAAKPNRPRFLLGQGWVCLAAVVERGWSVGAVPLLLRLVRCRGNGGKLATARLMMRLLGERLGHVRLLVAAWYMRRRLVLSVIAAGHCVIGRVRKDTARFLTPPTRTGRRGRPRKYGARLTPEQVATLPVKRSAQILYRQLEVVRYRTCWCVARFLNGTVVRVVWVELERPDRPGRRSDTWLWLCTDPTLPPLEVIRSYAKRWAVESLFHSLKHQWGVKDAWQRRRQVLMRWVTVLAAGFALNQILAFSDPARLGGLAQPTPWRASTSLTAGIVRDSIGRIFGAVGLTGVLDRIVAKFTPPPQHNIVVS